ncbi:zinc finger protein 845-like [Galendromus occidentalis]|uniref:Zinc finger protein 845-like n=1 Tax=Galendromus occidentalis TaxID=34638 RepID=A0AAJ7SGD3_9ACAR|nr:zinc finger protein 845-like [Galendromus occidentalis]
MPWPGSELERAENNNNHISNADAGTPGRHDGKEREYKCYFCEKTFSRKYRRDTHVRCIHTKEKPYPCPHCSNTYASQDKVWKHINTAHPDIDPSYDVDEDDSRMMANEEVALGFYNDLQERFGPEHYRRFGGMYFCRFCAYTNAVCKSLKKHFYQHHAAMRPYVCSYCPKTFAARKKRSVAVEAVGVFDSDDKDCRKAGENDSRKEQEEEEEPQPMPPENNTKETSKEQNRTPQRTPPPREDERFNSKIHCAGNGRQVDGVYYCALCDFQHSNYVSIRDHFYKNHQAASLLKCSFCERQFSRGTRLEDHIRAKHTNEKPFTCKRCNKKFASTSARLMHYDLFSNNEFYGDISRLMERNNNALVGKYGDSLTQDASGKMARFNRESDLQKVFQEDEYIVRDPDERFRCLFCEHRTSSRSRCREHVRTHTGVKPYQCAMCGRCFNKRECRDNHVRSRHTLEKPYNCNLCPKSYSSSAALAVHRKTCRIRHQLANEQTQ